MKEGKRVPPGVSASSYGNSVRTGCSRFAWLDYQRSSSSSNPTGSSAGEELHLPKDDGNELTKRRDKWESIIISKLLGSNKPTFTGSKLSPNVLQGILEECGSSELPESLTLPPSEGSQWWDICHAAVKNSRDAIVFQLELPSDVSQEVIAVNLRRSYLDFVYVEKVDDPNGKDGYGVKVVVIDAKASSRPKDYHSSQVALYVWRMLALPTRPTWATVSTSQGGVWVWNTDTWDVVPLKNSIAGVIRDCPSGPEAHKDAKKLEKKMTPKKPAKVPSSFKYMESFIPLHKAVNAPLDSIPLSMGNRCTNCKYAPICEESVSPNGIMGALQSQLEQKKSVEERATTGVDIDFSFFSSPVGMAGVPAVSLEVEKEYVDAILGHKDAAELVVGSLTNALTTAITPRILSRPNVIEAATIIQDRENGIPSAKKARVGAGEGQGNGGFLSAAAAIALPSLLALASGTPAVLEDRPLPWEMMAPRTSAAVVVAVDTDAGVGKGRVRDWLVVGAKKICDLGTESSTESSLLKYKGSGILGLTIALGKIYREFRNQNGIWVSWAAHEGMAVREGVAALNMLLNPSKSTTFTSDIWKKATTIVAGSSIWDSGSPEGMEDVLRSRMVETVDGLLKCRGELTTDYSFEINMGDFEAISASSITIADLEDGPPEKVTAKERKKVSRVTTYQPVRAEFSLWSNKLQYPHLPATWAGPASFSSTGDDHEMELPGVDIPTSKPATMGTQIAFGAVSEIIVDYFALPYTGSFQGLSPKALCELLPDSAEYVPLWEGDGISKVLARRPAFCAAPTMDSGSTSSPEAAFLAMSAFSCELHLAVSISVSRKAASSAFPTIASNQEDEVKLCFRDYGRKKLSRGGFITLRGSKTFRWRNGPGVGPKSFVDVFSADDLLSQPVEATQEVGSDQAQRSWLAAWDPRVEWAKFSPRKEFDQYKLELVQSPRFAGWPYRRTRDALACSEKWKRGRVDICSPQNLLARTASYTPLPGPPSVTGNEGKVATIMTQGLTLLWGPPGSGKTTLLAEVILNAVNQGEKVLVVCATWAGVYNLILRAAEMSEDKDEFLEMAYVVRSMAEDKRITCQKEIARFKGNVLGCRGCAMEKHSGSLSNCEFQTVLVDESTQLSVSVAPLAAEAAKKRLVFAGDPQQLGVVSPFSSSSGKGFGAPFGEVGSWEGWEKGWADALSTLNDAPFTAADWATVPPSDLRTSDRVGVLATGAMQWVWSRVMEAHTRLCEAQIGASVGPTVTPVIALTNNHRMSRPLEAILSAGWEGVYPPTYSIPEGKGCPSVRLKSPVTVLVIPDGSESSMGAKAAICAAKRGRKLLKSGSGGIPSCMIMTPHRRQRNLINGLLRDEKAAGPGKKLSAATIDSSQGKEADIVVWSGWTEADCVGGRNVEGRVGFLLNPNRFNVAVTRAKQALYIIVSASLLRAAESKSAQSHPHLGYLARILSHSSVHQSNFPCDDPAPGQTHDP